MRQRPSDSAAPSECLPPPPPSTKPWEGVSSEFQVILKEVPSCWACRCLSKHLSLHQLCWGKVGLRDWFRETGTGTSAPWGPSVSVSAARIANDHQGRCLRSRCFSRRIHTRTGRAVVPEAGLLHCLLHGVQPTSFPLVVLGWLDVLPPKVALPTVLADVCLCGAGNRG